MTMSIAKLDGGTAESHGETRRQHPHLQLRSGRLHNGTRVGTRGSLHHLRKVVISVSWKEFQKIYVSVLVVLPSFVVPLVGSSTCSDVLCSSLWLWGVVFCRQDTHSQYTSVQYNLFTCAERTPRVRLTAQRSSHTDCMSSS